MEKVSKNKNFRPSSSKSLRPKSVGKPSLKSISIKQGPSEDRILINAINETILEIRDKIVIFKVAIKNAHR
jgi:hypothetical protein